MSDSPHPSRRRALAVGLAVLVPVVPIVVALFLTGAKAAPTAPRTATAAYQPVSTTPSASSGQATGSAGHARRPGIIPPGHGALIGYVSQPQAMRRSPGGPKLAELQTRTGFGSPTIVLVAQVRANGRWLGVINTHAGNGRIGWIHSTGVRLSRNSWALHAVLSRHTLYVTHGGRTVQRFSIATGAPDAPTPTGTFAVTDRLSTGNPGGPYGCCILALSATAPHHISDWDGGNRIAIHSTPETGSIGYSVSHGCMRLSLPDGQWLIDHIPDGTRTRISSA